MNQTIETESNSRTRILPTHKSLRAAALLLVVAGVSLMGTSTLAFAGETNATPAKEDAPDHAKLLHEHLREKDGDAIRIDLANIAAAYAGVSTKATRNRMLKAVGKALRFRNEDIQREALDAFEEMKDPEAWRHYRSLLSQPFKDSFPRLASQAMDVTRALTPDAAVGPLLRILKKSRNLPAAAKALDTLGAYGESRHRKKILGEIISVTQKEKPGIRGRDNTVVYGPRQSGEAARNRWQALARPMVEAANELTGQDLRSPDEWFSTWRSHKGDPSSLFQGGGDA